MYSVAGGGEKGARPQVELRGGGEAEDIARSVTTRSMFMFIISWPYNKYKVLL